MIKPSRAVCVLVAGLLLAGCSSNNTNTAASATSSADNGSGGGPVTAVKIDNVADARPATGLGSANTIYVAPVEGGLTRIIAVFTGTLPDSVGPVRSARQTDIDLLAQYGRPTFAYSGSAPQLQPMLQAASVVNASQANVPKAYYRGNEHAAPHNLYLHPAQLPTGTPPPGPVLLFGAAPAGGTPTTDRRVSYPAASFAFHWAADPSRWQVSMDGTPFRSTEAGQLTAATVVIQQVAIGREAFPEDATGAVAPIARTVGSGSATILRDGQSFAANWSRSTAALPTEFTLTGSAGTPVPFATGPVWILLVPQQ